VGEAKREEGDGLMATRTPKIPDQALAKIPGKALYRMATAGAEIETGGDHPSLVLPEVRSKKWGGECWLNVRHKDAGELDKKDRAKNFKRKGKPALEVPVSKKKRRHQFIEGSLEWDIVYDDRAALPTDGVERFELDFPASLTWHYQPPLTQEEIEQGAKRPENVVGSYAGYFDKSGSFVDKNGNIIADYQTGKYCHIYRPEMIAADGARIWLEQVIVDNELRVTLPDSSWFDAHPGPWTLDPTIGYEAEGSSYINMEYGETTYAFYLGEMAENGTALSLSFLNAFTYDRAIECGCFETDGKDVEPFALVAESGPTNTDSITWETHAISGSLTSGMSVYGAVLPIGDGNFYGKYDSVTGYDSYRLFSDTSGVDAALKDNTTINYVYSGYRTSGYVTYEVAGGGGGATYTQSVSGALSAPSGGLSRQLTFGVSLSGIFPEITGSISKKIGKTVVGSHPSASGAISKSVSVSMSGVAPGVTGAASTGSTLKQSVDGVSPSPSGGLTKRISTKLTGVAGAVIGGVRKKIGKVFSGIMPGASGKTSKKSSRKLSGISPPPSGRLSAGARLRESMAGWFGAITGAVSTVFKDGGAVIVKRSARIIGSAFKRLLGG
jgi:hypothetical protein